MLMSDRARCLVCLRTKVDHTDMRKDRQIDEDSDQGPIVIVKISNITL